jgi:hypothetical protein
MTKKRCHIIKSFYAGTEHLYEPYAKRGFREDVRKQAERYAKRVGGKVRKTYKGKDGVSFDVVECY